MNRNEILAKLTESSPDPEIVALLPALAEILEEEIGLLAAQMARSAERIVERIDALVE